MVAVPFFLWPHWPKVFNLIQENNFFMVVQDQALLLVEFDQELVEKRKVQGEDMQGWSATTALLVDHTHSITVCIQWTRKELCQGLILVTHSFPMWFNNCKFGPSTSTYI
jgi:hypothetical protein